MTSWKKLKCLVVHLVKSSLTFLVSVGRGGVFKKTRIPWSTSLDKRFWKLGYYTITQMEGEVYSAYTPGCAPRASARGVQPLGVFSLYTFLKAGILYHYTDGRRGIQCIHPRLCTPSISQGCTAFRGVFTVHLDLPYVLWFYHTALICNHSNLMTVVHNCCTPLHEYLKSCTPLHEYQIRLYTTPWILN